MNNSAKITENFRHKFRHIAEILESHGVIRDSYDVEDFVPMVEREALSGRSETVEITYRETSVRLFIKLYILITADDEGKVISAIDLRNITAVPHPEVNPKMDYEKLNEDLSKYSVKI